MKKNISVFILLLLCAGCADKSKDLSRIANVEWLIGTWQNISQQGTLVEVWTKTSDICYSGNSFMIVKNDTVFSESISLELQNGELFYIPNVSGQNNGKPVSFKFISDAAGEFMFENKEHDFPQRIIYKNPKPDSLYARVEGIQEGEYRKEEFYMSKEK